MVPGLTIKPKGEAFSESTGSSVAIEEEESRETENINRPVIESIIIFFRLMRMGRI